MSATPPDLTDTETVLGDWNVPRTADMVPETRRHIRWLACLCVGNRFDRDAEVMAGEMLTNALQHGNGERTRVRVSTTARILRVEVHDAGTAPIVQRYTGDGLPEHGRGLVLVAFLATRWGLQRTETGTCAWFEIAPDEKRADDQA